MNKTININLGGFFFHIDESAYQKLRRYLDAISKSLNDDPQGKNEIIADIEARISELLSERITDARQVVNEGDIDEIITIMGQPEDYAEAEETYNDASYSYQRNHRKGKKLFRDGDDKFLGGVASGIAHYFNTDAIWIRLAFLITTLAGFGTGVLVYIVLWVLLAEAKTTAEKLQMEGEPVNIDNIEKKIREEFQNVTESVKNVANQASDKIKDGANEFSEKINQKWKRSNNKNDGFQDFINALGNIVLAIFKIVGKCIGVLLIIISAITLIAIILGIFSIGSLEFLNIDGHFLSYPPFFYGSMLPKYLLTTLLFILIGIPFLSLFILGLRILSSSVQKMNKATSLSLLGIWIIALLGVGFAGIEFGTSHVIEGTSVDKIPLRLVKKDTLNIKVINDDTLFYNSSLRRNRDDKEQVEVLGEMKLYSTNISIDVKASNSEESYFTIKKSSFGRNKITAKKDAEAIKYHFEQKGNTIVLDAFFISDYQNMFKDEEVKITIFLANGVTVYFDHSSKNFLQGIDNTTNTYDREMATHYFLMTQKGLHSPALKALEDLNTVTEK
jgi:phage shock protein PspC (stress-responsive transcriptional regulator)